MIIVLLQRSDGGVSVAHINPTKNPGGALARTVEQWQDNERMTAQQRPGYVARTIVSTRVIEPSDLPENRRWRDAWMIDGNKVAIDLDKAKTIRAAELESEKNNLLETHAKEYTIAVAKGDAVAAQAIQKKVQDLSSLDKTAIELSVAAVADLAALDTHEPDPIKDAKQEGKK